MADVIKTQASGLPAARSIRWNPSPAELRELTSRMPNARHTAFDNYNVQTKVVSRSKAQHVRGHGPAGGALRPDHEPRRRREDRGPSGRVHPRPGRCWSSTGTSATTLTTGSRPGSTSRRPTPTSRACSTGCTSTPSRPARTSSPCSRSSTRPTWSPPDIPNDRVIAVDLEAGITRVLNSDYFGEFEEGRSAHVEQAHLRPGRALAACRVQGGPDRSRRSGPADHRPVGYRQDNHDIYSPERQQTGAGRLRRAVSRRPDRGHRERMLRKDVRA